MFNYTNTIKRALDLTGAVAMLPIFGACYVFIAPAIKITDGGPVFFSGLRRGKSGVPFKMLKFRSMRLNALDVRNSDGSTFSAVNDPRVTPIGRVIRKFSVDEIPQVFNVLAGQMSFVGPRPDMASRSWEQLSDLEKERLAVRPGITGLSQALYRNAISPEERDSIDAYYIEHMSLLLDLRVVLLTLSKVLRAKNVTKTGSVASASSRGA